MISKEDLVRAHYILSEQFGLDPLKLLAGLRGVPGFIRDLLRLRETYKGKIVLKPCLGDRFKEAGSARDEYFIQDLLVAQMIFKRNPDLHVDVGSRIDGFVAHIASFRSVEVIDIRPAESTIPGLFFRQADLMSEDILDALCLEHEGYCDSLSCLHAIEHFGLGRYGDPFNPFGYKQGIRNLAKLLRREGFLYLSTPVGSERIEFNASWIFDPRTILGEAHSAGLALDGMIIIDRQGRHNLLSLPTEEQLDHLGRQQYLLAIFVFIKTRARNEIPCH